MTQAKYNEHRFKFTLPMLPNFPKEGEAECELLMDGQQMKGVTGGHLRFGANGFTNVVMEFECSALAEFAAHLVAHMDVADPQAVLGGIFDLAAESASDDLVMMNLDGDVKAEFVKRIIETTVEQIKSSNKSIRESFENWCKESGHFTDWTKTGPDFENYQKPRVQLAWEVWQACNKIK